MAARSMQIARLLGFITVNQTVTDEAMTTSSS